MSAKQKIVHGRGLSNLNLRIFVCSFDVCRASKPIPCINNGVFLQSENHIVHVKKKALSILVNCYIRLQFYISFTLNYTTHKTDKKQTNKKTDENKIFPN